MCVCVLDNIFPLFDQLLLSRSDSYISRKTLKRSIETGATATTWLAPTCNFSNPWFLHDEFAFETARRPHLWIAVIHIFIRIIRCVLITLLRTIASILNSYLQCLRASKRYRLMFSFCRLILGRRNRLLAYRGRNGVPHYLTSPFREA